ncbi:rab-like protein 2B isoform X2 [Chelonia mydas]|uniref:rab-like protein 2B isoform X2 n=1 Tax=Chelonia mydas TaxID=8469 RepID=UPI000FFBEEED|nr:rab-like protein 2B isoform X2 [Chelonia mydas]
MARDAPGGDSCKELDQTKYDADENVKIICLGDSAVGKSKLMERFLLDGFRPQQLSTFALTLYKYTTNVDGKNILVDFWDTAGQERFQSMHASYYHKAHACIMVFDVQRKVTYKNLNNWYKELREFRPEIPCIVVANKIDACHPLQVPLVVRRHHPNHALHEGGLPARDAPTKVAWTSSVCCPRACLACYQQ